MQELYEYLEATILTQASPEEAFRKFDLLANKHIEMLRKVLFNLRLPWLVVVHRIRVASNGCCCLASWRRGLGHRCVGCLLHALVLPLPVLSSNSRSLTVLPALFVFLLQLTKQIQDARMARDNELIKNALKEYDEALER